MALRRKTAYEEWAARYRGGKPAPKESATTMSGLPLQPLYTPADLEGWDYDEKLGYPGEFPYTRGVYPSMYRGQPWTIRQFAGYGTAQETNRRYKFLLAQGQAGLSVAFDMPTLMGYDSDDPLSDGEVGHCGVAIDSLEDMETLFEGIRLDQITTSMTINSPAAILYAMYIAVAEKEGVSPDRLGGTLQNDILKEYIAQKEYIFPPEPSMRLVVDTIVFAARHMPRWNAVSISGYHIREAGSTATQELAFTLADGMAYVEASIKAGRRSTSSRPGSPSSSTRTSISSRRSPSSAPPAACGRASCATSTAPAIRSPGCCASTPRPPACH
jgi:methylmalonyl-CoA mutase N-terminal domain/subunit